MATDVPKPPRKLLFAKYFIAVFGAVVVPLLVAGASEAWLGYRDQRARLSEQLALEARLAAVEIHNFLEGISDQLTWMVHLPWSPGVDERRRLDGLRLLRQVPSIMSLRLIDGSGKERLYVSRIGLNRVESGEDFSKDPAVLGAAGQRAWMGPVTFQGGSEPFMTVAVAGNRSAVGTAIAEVNLKFIWEVISAIRVGRTGEAYVLDHPGNLVAHPDISLVLRADEGAVLPLQLLRTAISAQAGQAIAGRDINGQMVMAAMATIPVADWSVIAKQPLTEAFGPIYAALWRTGLLLVGGAILAVLLAYWLTQRMVRPIRRLEDGVARIGAGEFDHRIHLTTGDELERLAERLNDMAGELAVSQERSERIGRLKRFLAPQVAELVDQAGDDRVLDGRRVEVVVVFCDLRGFTAFSARAEPEIIISALSAYYEALDRVITAHGATLVSFLGDGVMVLVNAPVACSDPALRAVTMACDMQAGVQLLLAEWHRAGHELGFGVGLAMGPATVGRIGAEGRFDYTAIGNVVNLAARLCASAKDGEILVDRTAAQAVGTTVVLVEQEARALKGFDQRVPIFAVDVPLRDVRA
ncbi:MULTISPECIES: adenylate/guanylate cyclase domain-containing protein [unclassified Chelatococcus]|uniref:adenylate/guanylate cyclase domain-containing protein n=1 Tax=unclassified Chelatococcus TaxID=2638111 RepID=UPI001BCE0885|nr:MULTISPECIES: adenylate/guanylate cyclase domain-containing protein [unclassified Chelatococcus]CAH1656829.1 Class 3 adenylate cyclase [Hyphomicrobiales bacterium]MBS7742398.1 HAMP domain-containing protein [Chelatococcus sp. HY11]MBX3542484.1 HAMP domain-containing protein [Chelatococcus sp.]MCO5075299.1 HAMP domain-containing protein [Chelatococcus sp.]CAH1695917.1 Class 3 adenylate cyclase [Hyphomicrobiales bacterium]